MKFILPTIGSRGDVQPYIALASALQEAEHEAIVATHPCMRTLVESYQVNFAPIGPDIDIGMEAAASQERFPNFITGMIRVMRFSFDVLEKAHEDTIALCEGVDAVIVSHSAAGSIEADKLRLPKISVTLHPQAITAFDPSDPLFKRIVGSLAGWGMSYFMSRPLDRIRRRLGVPPMGPEGITSRLLNLIPVSPHVIEPDPRWESRHRMTGYWFSGPAADWSPPQELATFLEDGEPPVVINLGAMALDGRGMQETALLTIEALRQAGLRAIIQGWDAVLSGQKLPDQILHAGSLPHTYLLPKAAGFVHHGGFGSTAAAFQAGVPTVVIPHIIDQYIWGQKVFELGVGPKPIPRKKLTASGLASALNQVVKEQEMRNNAAQLGKTIRSETGLENAVRLIHQYLC